MLEIAEPGAAILLLDRDAVQPSAPIFGPQIAREAVGAVDLGGALVPTSAATVVTLAPVSRTISLAAASRARSSRPLMTTSQPASASAVAQALPRPLLDAQTTALRPFDAEIHVELSNTRMPAVPDNAPFIQLL
jgi:hypothetical protein